MNTAKVYNSSAFLVYYVLTEIANMYRIVMWIPSDIYTRETSFMLGKATQKVALFVYPHKMCLLFFKM